MRRLRRQGVLFVLVMVTLPLQWQDLARSPLGVLHYLHVTAAVFLVFLLLPGWSQARRQVLRAIHPFGLVFLLYTASYIVASVANGVGAAQVVQQALYAMVGFGVAQLFWVATRVDDRRTWRTMSLAAPATVVIFLLAFSSSASRGGVNVVATVSRSIITGDPGVMQFALFRSVFAADLGEAAQANLRHEMFGALVVAGCVSAFARRRARSVPRWLDVAVTTSLLLIAALTVVSLSRSALLGAAALPLLLVVRQLGRRHLTRRFALGLIACTVVVLPLAVSPVPRLLWNRLTVDTGSYTGRVQSLSASLDALPENLMFGGKDLSGSHNFILDAASRGGFITGLFALATFACIAVGYGRAARAYVGGRGPSDLLPVLVAASLALVRLVTAGAGTLHLVGWVSLGMLAGVTADPAWRGSEQTSRDRDQVDEAPAVPEPLEAAR